MSDAKSALTSLLSQAIERRDELDVFIKCLTNVMQGRDLLDDNVSRWRQRTTRPVSDNYGVSMTETDTSGHSQS